MKNIMSKKHFPQGHFSQASAQFKLNQCQQYIKPLERVHLNKNATSAELGLVRESRSKIRINQCKYESQISDMMPKKVEIYKSKRRPSPLKLKSSKDMLSHSVDFVRSSYVEREASFLSLQKKTSQSGFYQRPQVSVSLTRIKENEASKNRIIGENKENVLFSLINKQIKRDPITGMGVPDQDKTGIKCNHYKKSPMDEILFQNRDLNGRKKWDIKL